MAYFHNNSSGTNARTIYVNYVDGGGDNHMAQNSGISSVSDHGTGNFTVNFSSNFSDTGYAFFEGTSSENTNGNRGANGQNIEQSNKAVGSCKVFSYYGSTGSGNGNYNSPKTCTMAFIGDLA